MGMEEKCVVMARRRKAVLYVSLKSKPFRGAVPQRLRIAVVLI